MSGRKHNNNFKLKVALAAIKEEQTMPELCQKFDLHKSVIGRWKRQLLENGATVFQEAEVSNGHVKNQAEIDQLHAKIGELVMERDYLKKVLDA